MPSIELGICTRCYTLDAVEILEGNYGLCFTCAGGLDMDLDDPEENEARSTDPGRK